MSAPSTRSCALRLSGTDVLGLLHRVTTQKLLDLAPGESRITLFCDPRGRLQHRATVVRSPDSSVWLLRDDAPGAELAIAVESMVFRDDVRVEDFSPDFAVRLVRTASGVRARFGENGAPTLIPEREGLALAVGDAGSAVEFGEFGRMMLGRARQGGEIREAFTPYETNLAAYVHLDKGCYTGQEALQRLVTYDGVRRQLVRFEGEGAAPAPQELLASAEPAGELTSSVAEGGAWVALGVARMDAVGAGEPFSLADGMALASPFVFERARALGRG